MYGFNTGDKVEVISRSSFHNGRQGKVRVIYPAGMVHQEAKVIIEYRNEDGHYGEYKESELKRIY